MHYTPDEDGYVKLGLVASRELGMQTQYASYYAAGIGRRPNFGEGLRFRNLDDFNYHAVEIHVDDIPEFVRRIKEYLRIPSDNKG